VSQLKSELILAVHAHERLSFPVLGISGDETLPPNNLTTLSGHPETIFRNLLSEGV
jgi:hypothetical protein